MWKHIVAMVCLALFLAACSTAGEVTGKAVKGVENAAGDFKKGYSKGRTE